MSTTMSTKERKETYIKYLSENYSEVAYAVGAVVALLAGILLSVRIKHPFPVLVLPVAVFVISTYIDYIAQKMKSKKQGGLN